MPTKLADVKGLSTELNKIIESLDTAVGMLLLPAMKDSKVKKAMEIVSQASFLIGEIINER